MLNLNINLKKGFLLRIKKINLFTDGVKNGLLATELMVLFFSNTYKNILKSVLFFFYALFGYLTHCFVKGVGVCVWLRMLAALFD